MSGAAPSRPASGPFGAPPVPPGQVDPLAPASSCARDDDRLSDTELVTMVLSLVFAGHETTAHLIGNATIALLTHPDQLALLRADPGLWPGAVNELMRWCGPVLLSRVRYATVEMELGDTRLQPGDAVEAVLVCANFDPRVYDEP